jgi:MoaA/NifB/PqqE/SkfB family radical SAM enzyme
MQYALPRKVGEYGTKEAFDACRVEDGQWVFWRDRVELVLAGRYSEVKPLHVELSPTYLCNFACPWCSCRSAREDWSDRDVFNRPDATTQTVAPLERLEVIVRRLASERVDIQWVGGEPTSHRHHRRSVERTKADGDS